MRVKWRQVFGVLGERVSSTTHSLTHPLARASSAVGQRLHALMHFCRAAVPSLSATLAPRAPLLAGVLWGLDQADRVLYKDDDTPPPVVQDLPAKLLHSGMYAMQSHAEVRRPDTWFKGSKGPREGGPSNQQSSLSRCSCFNSARARSLPRITSLNPLSLCFTLLLL